MFAKKFKLGDDVVGKFISTHGRSDSLDTQIVGLVQDAKYSNVKDSVDSRVLCALAPGPERRPT